MGASVYDNTLEGNQEELVNGYLPLVKKIGLHMVARLPPSIELDDLMQVGVIGLLQASTTYDPSRGASFATYAGIRIKGAMLDEVRRNDWVPRSVQQNMKLIADTITELESQLGRSASDKEIADAMDIPLEEYHKLSRELAYSRLAPLDETTQTLESGDPEPFAFLEDSRMREDIVAAIGQLPEREALMMSLYYGEELNLKEIGEVMGVSESRVSQIHGQALARIRAKLAEQTQ
ncbi:MAG: RNA polymerase sigma factor FliA [Halioglobus sp.]|nr:RNA polymerase sigma factor FliA [Halioglobus sp.]|tara:strand:+ start:2083 stop:2784 length:702 start_codon:yes stop_codon:yes gene_type:complete